MIVFLPLTKWVIFLLITHPVESYLKLSDHEQDQWYHGELLRFMGRIWGVVLTFSKCYVSTDHWSSTFPLPSPFFTHSIKGETIRQVVDLKTGNESSMWHYFLFSNSYLFYTRDHYTSNIVIRGFTFLMYVSVFIRIHSFDVSKSKVNRY